MNGLLIGILNRLKLKNIALGMSCFLVPNRIQILMMNNSAPLILLSHQYSFVIHPLLSFLSVPFDMNSFPNGNR